MRDLAGLLLVVAAGHGLLRLLVGREWPFGLVGGLAFSYLSGTAVVALGTTWLGIAGLPVRPLWQLPWLVGLAVAGAFLVGRPALRTPSPAGVLAALCGGVLAALASNGRVLLTDEYAIWALRGRALALAGELGPRLFANVPALYQHLDYPLLVPAVISWADGVAGHTADGAAHVYLALFAFALLGVVAWGAERLAGRWAAVVAIVLAVTATRFAAMALRLTADVPADAFALAALLLLLVWLRDGDVRLLRVAVVMVAGAAAVKNEGALYAGAVVLGVAVAAPLARRAMRAPLAVLLLAVLASLPWAIWVRAHDLPNELLNEGTGDRLGDAGGKLGVIADLFVHIWPASPVVSVLFVAAVALAVRRAPAQVVALLVALVLSIAGLMAVYVVTPFELRSHLGVSAYRVLLFPALLVSVAVPVLCSMRPAQPEETDARGGP